MTDDRSGSCPTCFLRDPHTPLLCDVCRSKLRTWLGDIPDLFAQLTGEPMGHVPGTAMGGRVSGSKEKRLPIDADRVDLSAPARNVWLFGEDQVGYSSVASTLDFWVRDWREARGGLERLPVPTVPELSAWLVRRADDAMDAHPAVDEMWHDVRRVVSALRGRLGLIAPKPEHCAGIPCKPPCDLKELYRLPDTDRVECAACRRIYTAADYDDWCKELLETERSRRRVAA